MIRTNQKGPIETVEPVAGISLACNGETFTGVLRSPGVIDESGKAG